ncbi:hypothetical protein [[Clostridium] aminophilum]|uniref:hypothetical protein n=1 Tax=[Clostridium] aminophilum TaxID=1526 RepID=UPI00332F9F9B
MSAYRIEDALEDELKKDHINWATVQRVIENNKRYINEFEDEDSALSDCYEYFDDNGKNALELTRLFLENGFDVTANNGRNGASCLHKLCWSFYDQYILDVAELLLDAGADTTIAMDEDDEEGVLGSISSKLDYWSMGEMTDCPSDYYYSANIFEAYYLMAERAQMHKDYHGIRAFDAAIGHRLDHVEEMTGFWEGSHDKRRILLFHSEGMILEARASWELFVNPFVKEYAIECKDVSETYKEIMGSRITDLYFPGPYTAVLNFDNGRKLEFDEDIRFL